MPPASYCLVLGDDLVKRDVLLVGEVHDPKVVPHPTGSLNAHVVCRPLHELHLKLLSHVLRVCGEVAVHDVEVVGRGGAQRIAIRLARKQLGLDARQDLVLLPQKGDVLVRQALNGEAAPIRPAVLQVVVKRLVGEKRREVVARPLVRDGGGAVVLDEVIVAAVEGVGLPQGVEVPLQEETQQTGLQRGDSIDLDAPVLGERNLLCEHARDGLRRVDQVATRPVARHGKDRLALEVKPLPDVVLRKRVAKRVVLGENRLVSLVQLPEVGVHLVACHQGDSGKDDCEKNACDHDGKSASSLLHGALRSVRLRSTPILPEGSRGGARRYSADLRAPTMSTRSSARLVMRFTTIVNAKAMAAAITYVSGSTTTSK